MCASSTCVAPYATCSTSKYLCDIDMDSDSNNCGVCGNVCSLFPEGFPPAGRFAYWGCSAGECDKHKCFSPWADCNNDISDGCEINLQTDRLNCGQCGKACAPGERCANGTCQCDPGPSGCDCLEDFEADLMNCGACGNRCLDRNNAPATCKFGRCGNVCAGGFGDCNADMTDGCEIDIMRDPQNCGACGNQCATGQACIEGKCAVEPCPDGVIQ